MENLKSTPSKKTPTPKNKTPKPHPNPLDCILFACSEERDLGKLQLSTKINWQMHVPCHVMEHICVVTKYHSLSSQSKT